MKSSVPSPKEPVVPSLVIVTGSPEPALGRVTLASGLAVPLVADE